MKELKYVITDPQGIHARPAGMLVKAVKGFESEIQMSKDGRAVNCKGVMSLGAKQGEEITLAFNGADEDVAMEAVSKFMQENL